MPRTARGVERVEPHADGEGELVQRHQEAADAGQHVDQAEHPELPGARRLGQRPFPDGRRRAASRRRRFPLAAGQQGGQRQQQRQARPPAPGRRRASRSRSRATAPPGRRRRGRGRWPIAAPRSPCRAARRRAARSTARRPPCRCSSRRASSPRRRAAPPATAHRAKALSTRPSASRPPPRSIMRRDPSRSAIPPTSGDDAPLDHLADRVGDARLGPVPAEFRGEGQQEHGVGVHQAGAEREGEEARPENQPSPADPVADPRRVPLFGAVRGHARSAPAVHCPEWETLSRPGWYAGRTSATRRGSRRPLLRRPRRGTNRESRADEERRRHDRLGQVQAPEPPRHRGPGARAAPLLLLRDGPDRGGDRPALRRRRHLLERGRALQHRALPPGAERRSRA